MKFPDLQMQTKPTRLCPRIGNSSVYLKLSAWALLSFASNYIHAATGLIDVGTSPGMRFFIESSSLKLDNPILRYRLVGQGTLPNVRHSFVAEVGVDCTARKRIEYVSVSTWDGRSTTTSASSSEMRAVYAGTRQADEVNVACNFVNEGSAKPEGQPEARPQDPGTAQMAIPAPSTRTPQPAAARPVSSGTGFAVAVDGIFITNFHVISDCNAVKGLVNSRLHEARIVASDEANDLAAIHIASATLPALPIASVQPDLGSPITVLGYPLSSVLGTDLKASTGIVSSLSGVRGERRNMQISAAVQPGNSGGPVLDDRGFVVGVVVAKLASRFAAENVNFAVRGPLIRSFLEINNIEPIAVKQHRQLSVAEVVKKAAPSTILLLCY